MIIKTVMGNTAFAGNIGGISRNLRKVFSSYGKGVIAFLKYIPFPSLLTLAAYDPSRDAKKWWEFWK